MHDQTTPRCPGSKAIRLRPVRFKAGSNVAKTMKQAVEIVGNQKADKYIFLVTDCYNPKNKVPLREGFAAEPQSSSWL
jgi:hypothetical protein